MNDDEQVELAARTLYESHYADKPKLGWARETESYRHLFRQQARTATTAAPGTEGDE